MTSLNNWTKYQQTRKRDLSSNNDKPTTLKARMKKIGIYLRQVDFGQTWSCWARPPFRSSSLPSDDCLTPISLSSEELHLEKISLQLWEFSSPRALDSATKIRRSCLAGSFFRGSSSRPPDPSLATDQIRTLAFTKWFYIFVIGCHCCAQFLGICDYSCVENTNMKLRSLAHNWYFVLPFLAPFLFLS